MRRRLLLVLVSAAVAIAGCGDDGESATPSTAADASTTTATTAAVETTTTAAAAERLAIVVTNDDGIGGLGLDVLVQALQAIPDVEVTIVAPAEDNSGSSDTTTAGPVTYADAATVSGIAGTAVDGYPADTIAVALDQLGLGPDLVVSGINKGQNIGPFVPLSGTVGAARTALRRGIAAVAVSAGIDDATADYEGAAALVVDWIAENREALVAGTAPTDVVVNFNVPTCVAGETLELVEVPVAAAFPEGVDIFASDCSVPPATPPADDVTAIAAGHATVSEVPAEL